MLRDTRNTSPTQQQKAILDGRSAFESFNWIRGVSDDKRITVLHRFILIRILAHRSKNGECCPGYDYVADELGVGRASVFRAVGVAVRLGWMAPPMRRGRARADFNFIFPADVGKAQAAKVSTDDTLKQPAKVSNRGLQSIKSRPSKYQADLQAIDPEGGIATNEQREREREREEESPPTPSRGRYRRPPGDDERGKKSKTRRERKPDTADNGFDRFWAAYPLKVHEARARKEWAQAIEHTAPEAVIEAAGWYAARRTAEIVAGTSEPKHTAFPHNWLKGELWRIERPPANGGAVIDQHGNPFGMPRRVGREMSFFEYGMRTAAESTGYASEIWEREQRAREEREGEIQ